MLQRDPPRLTLPSRIRAGLAHPALVVGFVGAMVGFAGSWIPSYWGDEAASILSTSRSWPSLGALLGQIDGVHGLYYALLKLWTALFGTSEAATRLPSAIAVGLMAGGTVVLARRFVGTRIAVIAGTVCAILPRSTCMAAEARSYAIGAAIAVWITVLFTRLVTRDASRRQWLLYGIACAGAMYLFLYLGLMLVVHGVVAAILYRESLARWMLTAGGATLLAVPIILVASLQRQQIGFLARRHYATPANVLTRQWFGYPVLAVVAWLLILATVVWLVLAVMGRLPRGARLQATVFSLVWLFIPTAALLIGNALLSPMYNVRYLSFCVPAAALVMALGVAAIGELAAPHRRLAISTALTAALVAASVPVYLGQRTPWAKDGGSDWRAVAEYVQQHAHDGAVLFDQTTKPSRAPRIVLDLYPAAFASVDDVALQTPLAERAGLWDAVAPNADATSRMRGTSEAWAVEAAQGTTVPPDVALLTQLGFQVDSAVLIHRTTVYHLSRK
ncbi:glycosyltransferase family 39 protein [Microbacterium trichothecenolyticum]|uniref:Glycosyltransferase RgtA/B/C/D-like domain-containing protein n=1 Tax=Microbacterium trichothecenolyticum TaxID=69370 RepID=A0A0M2HGA1_MICTR|nr:glycosyltransferase family 39 protein [Microbacterium trichothecenolyticum]KJL43787.1 hypothetical protein RS82_01163 [Microbacterium trichothecenolyticum]